MNFKRNILTFFGLFLMLIFSLQNCQDKNENRWDIAVKPLKSEVKITDISKEYYDTKVDLEDFKKKYDWFQGTVSDEDFAQRRTDSVEVKIYQEAISKINVPKLEEELTNLFAHIQHYYPKFKTPKVYIFSSALQMVKQSPLIYIPQDNFLFIDVSSFMGEESEFYEGLETYYKTTMNPKNIVVKVADIIISNIVPFDKNNQKFIDHILYQGKKKVLLDAFLPKVSEHLKMNYSQAQYNWAVANEENIWNYFVENDLVFSPDPRLVDRFITEGPFSKFYTEIDQKSSPQVGIYIGWRIATAFTKENPEISLQDFLKLNATEIFNQSKYNPKNK